jgi:hypothetical protein
MPKTIATWLEKMEQEIAYQILKMMLPDVRERWNEAELALMEKKLVIQAFAVSTRVAVTQMIMADQVKEAADLRAKAM